MMVKHPDRGAWTRCWRALSLLGLFASALFGACVDVGDPWYVERALVEVPDGPVDFEQNVRPILVDHGCTVCHGGVDPEAGLDVTTVESFVAGGVSGPAIVRCDHTASLVVTHIDRCFMPPEGGCLSEVELEVIHRWIDEGALAEPDAGFCGGD